MIRVISVEEKVRVVIERFGRYDRTLKPGLRMIWLPEIMEKIKEELFIEEEGIALFEEPVKIDFRDGSAIPKIVRAFIEIESPDEPLSDDGEERTGTYKAVYHIKERKKAIKEVLENAVRSYLNGLTIEQGIEMSRAGYDLLGQNGMPEEEIKKLEKTLRNWGTILHKVVIGDFDLDIELVKFREELHKRKKEKEMASFVSERRAEETAGTFIEMISREIGVARIDIQKEIRERPQRFYEEYKDAIERILDLLDRRMAIDGNAFTDIRVKGAEGIERSLLNVVAAWKGIQKGKEKPEGKEKSEKKEGNEGKNPKSPYEEGVDIAKGL